MRPEEKRQYPRIDAQIEVSFPTPEAYVVEYSKNISKGGIFVKTAKLPDPNAVVELKLRFPGIKEVISILARVARTVVVSDPDRVGEQLYGVGFYFIEWSVRAKTIFDQYYKMLAEQAGVPIDPDEEQTDPGGFKPSGKGKSKKKAAPKAGGKRG